MSETRRGPDTDLCGTPATQRLLCYWRSASLDWYTVAPVVIHDVANKEKQYDRGGTDVIPVHERRGRIYAGRRGRVRIQAHEMYYDKTEGRKSNLLDVPTRKRYRHQELFLVYRFAEEPRYDSDELKCGCLLISQVTSTPYRG